MVCRNCNSDKHEAENCVAEKMSKDNNLKSYTCCNGEPNNDHLIGEKCKIIKNCIGWYSTEHHKLFCSVRLEAINFFLPKINQNLFQRFFETMEIDEKYSMLLTSPSAADLLKPIKIMDRFCNDDKMPIIKTPIVVHGTLRFNNADLIKDKKIFDLIATKSLICLPRVFWAVKPNVPAEMILQLLSPYTITFSISGSYCNPNITFSDVIKKAPNLKSISVYNFETNIIFDETWLEDLVKYKNGKNFEDLRVKLDTLEFDVENFVEFVRTKCAENIYVSITFNQMLEDDEDDEGRCWDKLEEISKKLYQYFDYPNEETDFSMGFDGGDSNGFTFLSLKKIKEQPKQIMAPRIATKRKYI